MFSEVQGWFVGIEVQDSYDHAIAVLHNPNISWPTLFQGLMSELSLQLWPGYNYPAAQLEDSWAGLLTARLRRFFERVVLEPVDL